MKYRLKDSPYFNLGMTALWVLCGCILFYTLLQHLDVLVRGAKYLIDLLNPFIWGFVISYLLLPIARFCENEVIGANVTRLTGKAAPKGGIARMVSIAVALVIAGIAIFVLFRILLPTVFESIETIVFNYSTYINRLVSFVNGLFEDNPELSKEVTAMTATLSNDLANWITNTVLPQVTALLTDVAGVVMNLTSGVYKAVQYVLNILIGVVISCYVLYNRDRFAATGKRMLYAMFGVKRSEQIQHVVHFANEAFMGFLTGKIIDSLIIGVLTYVSCKMLQMPFPAFIAIIVGVTNIIPIFGPFIGAIPCAILILMVDPVRTLAFLLLIFIIQQIDGNIIGPKILGNSVGINGFWIMFAIIVMGKLFGVAGMIIGVPLFAVLSAGYEALLQYGLKKRGLCQEAALYVDMDHIDVETGYPVPRISTTDVVGEEVPNTSEKSAESGE